MDELFGQVSSQPNEASWIYPGKSQNINLINYGIFADVLNLVKSLNSDGQNIKKAYEELSKNIGRNSEFSGDKDLNFKVEEKKLRHFRVCLIFQKKCTFNEYLTLFQLSYSNKTENLGILQASSEFSRRPCMDEITRAAAERFRPQKKKYFYLFGADNRDLGFRSNSDRENSFATHFWIPKRNLFTTVSGWWWNSTKKQGFLNRPMARDVSILNPIPKVLIWQCSDYQGLWMSRPILGSNMRKRSILPGWCNEKTRREF